MNHWLTALPTIAALLLFTANDAAAQGCVALRGSGHCGTTALMTGTRSEDAGSADRWQLSLGYQWFRAARHFVRDEPSDVPPDIKAVNKSHFLDIGLRYELTRRYSATLVVPFTYAERTKNYTASEAGGLGDIRLSGYGWMIDPAHRPDGNVLLGAGLKLPTGASDARDTFETPDGPVRAVVDPSIQPGDGGTGFTLELAAFRRLGNQLTGYLQGFYLFNPETQNDTETGIVDAPTDRRYFSITDQYFARAGLSRPVTRSRDISLSLGGRLEGVPVRDLLGSSDGLRRPGHSLSIEPGLRLNRAPWHVAATVPIAVHRYRAQSRAERRLERETGIRSEGDAAFADYIISVAVTRSF